MYQTEGMMDTPLNPPMLGGFTLPTATIETEGIKGPKFRDPNMPMPQMGNVMDTAARGITPTPPTPPFAQPSLYETYTKAGVNIPSEFSESSDEEIKNMFENMYRQKIMKKGGIKYKQKGLKGDQYKLDMNKDGQLTESDFKAMSKKMYGGFLEPGIEEI